MRNTLLFFTDFYVFKLTRQTQELLLTLRYQHRQALRGHPHNVIYICTFKISFPSCFDGKSKGT